MIEYLSVVHACFFLAIAVFSLLVNSLLLKFSTNLGTRNTPDTMVRWNPSTKPSLGGFGFYMAFLISIVFYLVLFGTGNAFANREMLGLIVVCTMGFMMGLADDAYNTRPFLKFIVQFLCGIVLIYSGIYITLFENLYLNYIVTVFWVVGMMNSLNMLDNMDGITASTCLLICGAGMLYLMLIREETSFYFILLAGMAATLLGFLYYNWSPSKMFMGDTGSQFLGAFMAAIAIKLFWNGTDMLGEEIQTKQILVSVLIFVVPIADTTTVFINRILRGQSPFVGGRDHTTHHLAYMGLKERHVAILLAAVTITGSVVSLCFINFIEAWSFVHVALFAACFLIIMTGLYLTTKLSRKKP